jgi:uncharacterized protein YeaO (DUF488 family)
MTASRELIADHLRLKRAYDPSTPEDGLRVLVDRLWPRGLRKADAAVDLWLKDVAPSTQLRKWFNHDARRWPEFRRRYATELMQHSAEADELRERVMHGPVTLLFAAHDQVHNHAIVLRESLLRWPNWDGNGTSLESARESQHVRKNVSPNHP